MKTYFLWMVLLTTPLLQAQRTAPVAGDAAVLIDLLQKDYATGKPDTRMEDIARDRARVISIFKTYMDQDLPELSFTATEELRLTYTQSEEAYKAMERTGLSLSETEDLEDLNANFTEARRVYFDSVYKDDKATLTSLNTLLKDNAYLAAVLNKFETKYDRLKDNKADSYALSNSSLSIQKSLPFTGGDLLVEGIDGLSRFLAKRIKEELTLNAIQNIQAYLADKEKHPYLYELEVVLPTTITYLRSFDADQLLKFSDD